MASPRARRTIAPIPMPISSTDWQVDAIESDVSAVTSYLERVAGMPLLLAVAQRSLERLRLRTGQSVLDVGCGSGTFLPNLAAAVGKNGRVIGIDAAGSLVDAARTRLVGLSTVNAQHADAYALPFDDGSF